MSQHGQHHCHLAAMLRAMVDDVKHHLPQLSVFVTRRISRIYLLKIGVGGQCGQERIRLGLHLIPEHTHRRDVRIVLRWEFTSNRVFSRQTSIPERQVAYMYVAGVNKGVVYGGLALNDHGYELISGKVFSRVQDMLHHAVLVFVETPDRVEKRCPTSQSAETHSNADRRTITPKPPTNRCRNEAHRPARLRIPQADGPAKTDRLTDWPLGPEPLETVPKDYCI